MAGLELDPKISEDATNDNNDVRKADEQSGQPADAGQAVTATAEATPATPAAEAKSVAEATPAIPTAAEANSVAETTPATPAAEAANSVAEATPATPTVAEANSVAEATPAIPTAEANRVAEATPAIPTASDPNIAAPPSATEPTIAAANASAPATDTIADATASASSLTRSATDEVPKLYSALKDSKRSGRKASTESVPNVSFALEDDRLRRRTARRSSTESAPNVVFGGLDTVRPTTLEINTNGGGDSSVEASPQGTGTATPDDVESPGKWDPAAKFNDDLDVINPATRERKASSFQIDESNEYFLAIACHMHEAAGIPGDHTEKAMEWAQAAETCTDETLCRWIESRANVLSAVARKFKGEYDETMTEQLLGTRGFDGIVFDNKLKAPAGVQNLLNKTADPNARDGPCGFTASHAMAWSASLTSWFPESWHLDRLRLLRRAGGDIRCAVDLYGRTPLLLAMENSNVQFVKSILRVSLGETWALYQLRHMQLFAPGGKLIQELLHAKQMNEGAVPKTFRPRVGLGIANTEVDMRDLILAGSVRPMFRQPASMMSGIHWAASHDDASTIEVLVHLGLPVNHQVPNDDPNVQLPIILACVLGHTNAVEMLMRCNADPEAKNSENRCALDVAKQSEFAAQLVPLLSAEYPPFTQTLWGYKLCWDSVGVLAKLLERDTFTATSVEDLCCWYSDLGIEPQERVAKFWRFAAVTMGKE